MDITLKLADIAIIFATLLGPIFAVQAQKWLERDREVTDRQMAIFRTLMATRATRLAPSHVEALNATPIEFYGKSNALKQIMEAWRLYMEYLNRVVEMPGNAWAMRRDELYADLLQKMGAYLGFSFDKVQLQREVYWPMGHANTEQEQDLIRQGLVRVLTGNQSLQMSVQSFPVDPAIRETDMEIRALLISWLKSQLDDGSSDR
jgi:hypothetical protein